MPTARMRTRTSSGPITGLGKSFTRSSPGLLITNAFMSALLRKSCRPRSSRHLDQHLHLIAGGIEQGLEALLDDIVRLDLSRYHLVDRIGAALDHADDPRPHRHVIAPGRFDGDILQRPERRIDARLLHMK